MRQVYLPHAPPRQTFSPMLSLSVLGLQPRPLSSSWLAAAAPGLNMAPMLLRPLWFALLLEPLKRGRSYLSRGLLATPCPRPTCPVACSRRHARALLLPELPLYLVPLDCNLQHSREKTCLEFLSPSSMSYRIAERWVCNGGGQRPRKPQIWRTRHRRGSYSKSDKLLKCLEPLSNVKEEVYGALDGFIAWELDFPLIAVKKTLHVLQQQQNWTRVIQIIKWMLGKGQGRSLGNYQLLLQAFSEEKRINEAQELWKKVFSRNLECTPISLFVEIMRMYNRHEMYEDLLEVFADMEELNVNLNDELTEMVSATYEKLGSMDKAEKVRQKYASPKFRWRTIDGRLVKIRTTKAFIERGISTWVREASTDGVRAADESDAYGNLRVNDLDEKVEEEGLSNYGSEHDEEFQTEGEEEDFQFQGAKEIHADIGHFSSRQFVRNEVYM